MIATAVAAVGLVSLILVDHGPWSAPKAESLTMIQYGTTAAAAQAASAVVTETAPKPVLEPARGSEQYSGLANLNMPRPE